MSTYLQSLAPMFLNGFGMHISKMSTQSPKKRAIWGACNSHCLSLPPKTAEAIRFAITVQGTHGAVGGTWRGASWSKRSMVKGTTVDGRSPANQLRLVVYPILYTFLYF